MVGESLASISNCGSSYPKMTSLALGFGAGFGSAVVGSTGFQVRTQRDRKICSSGIRLLAIFLTVSVDNHELISFCFAAWNKRSSAAERFLSFTSALCLLAADARKAIWSGISFRMHVSSSSTVSVSAISWPCSCVLLQRLASCMLWVVWIYSGLIVKLVLPIHRAGIC